MKKKKMVVSILSHALVFVVALGMGIGLGIIKAEQMYVQEFHFNQEGTENIGLHEELAPANTQAAEKNDMTTTQSTEQTEISIPETTTKPSETTQPKEEETVPPETTTKPSETTQPEEETDTSAPEWEDSGFSGGEF